MSAAKLRNYLVHNNLRRVCLLQPNTISLLADAHTVSLVDGGATIDGVLCMFGQWVIVDDANNVSVAENLLNK